MVELEYLVLCCMMREAERLGGLVEGCVVVDSQ
jgi:hypothetical protein